MSTSPSKDNVLESFVKAANNHDFTLDISLNVKGAIISGTLISAKEYFKSLSKSFKGGNDVSKAISEKLEEGSKSAESNQSEAQYIHLKDTHVYIGDNKPIPSKGKILWRGNLDDIEGFFLRKIVGSSK